MPAFERNALAFGAAEARQTPLLIESRPLRVRGCEHEARSILVAGELAIVICQHADGRWRAQFAAGDLPAASAAFGDELEAISWLAQQLAARQEKGPTHSAGVQRLCRRELQDL